MPAQASFVHQWADLSSVLGLLVSLVGFAITIIGVRKSRGAALAAKAAAQEVRQRMSMTGAVSDLNRVVNELHEIRLLHRAGAWEVLLLRYSSIRRQLISIKGSHPELSEQQKATIQGVIGQFAIIEDIVEVAVANRQAPSGIPELNRTAAVQADKLNAILVAIEQKLRSDHA